MEFERILKIILSHNIDRETAEVLAQEILLASEETGCKVIYRVTYGDKLGNEFYDDYEDFDKARADYVHRTQGHLGDYNHVVFERYHVYEDVDGGKSYAECEEIDAWYNEGGEIHG